MNTELMNLTIAWLEAGAPERKFNMSKMVELENQYIIPNNWCGTTCCIAGYVWQLSTNPDDLLTPSIYSIWDDIENKAAKALELDYSVAHRLFYPSSSVDRFSYPGIWDKITAAEAAQAVRNVRDRGEPHWEEILDFSTED